MTLSIEMVRSDNLTARIQRRLRAVRARARYQLGMAVPNPGDVAVNRRFRHPVDAIRKPMHAMHYRDLFPDAVGPELREASRLAAHRFTILGHAMDHGERIAWSRDPASGRDWPRRFSPDIPYRGPDRLGDIKLPWELNKHQYFFTLGKAAWLSGNAATAIEIVRQIDHWIEDNPYERGINWISALETGTRAIAWIMAYPFYADRCDGAFRRRMCRSLAQHFLFVEQHLSTGRFANTHLIGEAAALVVGGLFLESRHSKRWLDTGLQILEQEIESQVTADGVHAERSVAYHRFFLDHYYLVAALLAANQRALTPAALARMETMTSFLMHVVLPDGSVPDVGDADDARGLWFRADSPTDYRGLLALGAALFKRDDFKAAAGRVTEEVFWLLGFDGVSKFEALARTPATEASAAYPEAGYYVMRGGWRASDPVLMFDCGPLGFGSAGHGHADALSVQLHAGGYPFLVDSGTFSYNLDYAWRNVFRTTRAHNTVVVDGESQSVPADRMSWESVAQSQPHRWITTRWFDLADGEHHGYRRLPDPVTHRRVVVFLKPDTWVIWDEVAGRTHHELEYLLHVRPDCHVAVTPEGEGCLTSPGGYRLDVRVSGEGNRPIAFEVLHGDDEHRDAWFSPGYGRRLPSRTLRVSRAFDGRCRLMTCLSASAQARPLVSYEQGVARIRVQHGEGGEERFFYRTEGVATLRDERIRFDGLLLAHRKVANSPHSVWASRFRELSIDGLLEVDAPTPIDRLVMENDRCEVEVDPAVAGRLRLSARDGISLAINGQPHQSGAAGVRAWVMTP